MILYTVMPLEDILEGIEEEPTPTVELVMGGITMELEPLGDFQARIVRLISSDPQNYLAPHLQPGTVIRLA